METTLRLWLSPEETAELEARNAAAVRADFELSERLAAEWLAEESAEMLEAA